MIVALLSALPTLLPTLPGTARAEIGPTMGPIHPLTVLVHVDKHAFSGYLIDLGPIFYPLEGERG